MCIRDRVKTVDIAAVRCRRCHGALDSELQQQGVEICRDCYECLKAAVRSETLTRTIERHLFWLTCWHQIRLAERLTLNDTVIVAIGCKAPVRYRKATNETAFIGNNLARDWRKWKGEG